MANLDSKDEFFLATAESAVPDAPEPTNGCRAAPLACAAPEVAAWQQAFCAQATPELVDQAVAYLLPRVRASVAHHAAHAPAVLADLVHDVLADTFLGTVAWDPRRASLILHVCSVVQSRLVHERDRAQTIAHVEIDDRVEAEMHAALELAHAPTMSSTQQVNALVRACVEELQALAADDVPVLELIEHHVKGLTERRQICEATGMSSGAYHNAFRRLKRLADKLPASVRRATLGALRRAP